MKRIMKTLMLVSMLVLGLAVAGCSSTPAPATEPTPEQGQGFNVGSRAPDFQLQSLDGETVALSDLRGKPVMLNFWATWCGPCRLEMPFIQEIFEDKAWADRLEITTVNVGEESSQVENFMEHYGLSFHVLLDKDTSVAQNYNIRGIPTTFFIDKNGIIKDVQIGAFREKAEIEGRLINSIMEDKS